MRFFIIIFALSLLFSFSVSLTTAQTADPKIYLLQPDIIGGQPGAQESSLGNYLSLLFTTLIGLAGGISALIIVISGLQYILSEVPGVKTSAKGRIQEALIGLVLALAAYLILYTINPDLTKLDLNLS